MRQIFGLLFLFSIVACGDKTQTTNTNTVDTATKLTDTTKLQSSQTVFNPYGFDSTYELTKEHQPSMVIGYFDTNNILDTAILVRHKSTGKDAIFIRHGGTDKSFLLKNGKDVGKVFADFNWVGQFEVIKKRNKSVGQCN